MKFIIYVIFILISFQSYCQYNFIEAGDTINVLYTDIQDVTLETSYLGFQYNIDINKDRKSDFMISGRYSEGISHMYKYIYIKPLHNNLIALKDSVPIVDFNDTVGFINKALGVNLGDTIDDNLMFLNKSMYLSINYYVVGEHVASGWGGGNYIPVVLSTNEGLDYGWINVSNVSFTDITIKSYAIQKIDNFTNEIEANIYPNPAEDYINIIPLNDSSSVTINIYNLVGDKQDINVYKENHNYRVLIENLSNGLYLLEYNEGNKSSRIKFLKRKLH